MAFSYKNYSFLNTVRRSPLFNFELKALGVKVEGRALLSPHRMYEYSLIAVAGMTVVDSSDTTGNYVVYGGKTLGKCKLSGTMHEGSYAANAFIASNESDAWRAFVGTYEVRVLATTMLIAS